MWEPGVLAQRGGQGDRVLQGEGGAGADGVVGGVGGVAEQHEVAVVPGVVGEGAEGLPRGAAGASQQRVSFQDVREELLQQGAAVGLAHPVESEAGPGLGRAFDDAGAAVGAVAVAPDPAVGGFHEREGEGVEGLGGTEPDVVVAPGREPADEVGGVGGAQGAADAVGRHDQIGAGGQVAGADLALTLQAYAEVAGPGGEDLQQPVAADAVALVATVPGRQAPDVGDTGAPADRVGVEDVRRLGVLLVEPVEQVAPVRHAPAVGGTLRIAFVDGDVVGRVLPLEQDREIQTGGPAADTGDLHAHPRE